MENIMTMFATFVAFCAGVVLITEAVNRIFKVKGSTAKLIVSWILSLGLAALGFGLQLGIFADCGAVTEWQGWAKAELIGLGCALCSNYAYDHDEIWQLLQLLFGIFSPKSQK
jgi:hypothetical protein